MKTSFEWNPIFVYEIRQAVRNRSVLAAICLYLAILVLIFGMMFAAAIQENRLQDSDGRLGQDLTRATLLMMFHTSLLVSVVFSVGTVIRQGLDEEMLFTTPLSLKTVIWGKFQVSILLTFLFYGAAAPFLTVAWLLRGVDLLPLAIALPAAFFFQHFLVLLFTAAFFRCRGVSEIFLSLLGILVGLPFCGTYYVLLLFLFLLAADTGPPIGYPILFGGISIGLFWLALFSMWMIRDMFDSFSRPIPLPERCAMIAGFLWILSFFAFGAGSISLVVYGLIILALS